MQLGLPRQHPTDIPLKDISIAYLTQPSLNLVFEPPFVVGTADGGDSGLFRCVTALTMPRCHTLIDRRDLSEQIGLGEDALEPHLPGTRGGFLRRLALRVTSSTYHHSCEFDFAFTLPLAQEVTFPLLVLRGYLKPKLHHDLDDL